MMDVLDTAMATASAEIHTENQGKARQVMIKLMPEQRARRFLEDGATFPADEKLCVCARCRHRGKVDELKENLEKRRKNVEKILVWHDAREEFKWAKENSGGDCVG